MLKIHSFLREMKGNDTPLGIRILKMRNKITAPVVYVTVAAMLVLNFSYFNGFNSSASELHAKAESIIDLLDEVEETQTSELFTTDMQQYTFSSLDLNKNISITEKLQKIEKITARVILENRKYNDLNEYDGINELITRNNSNDELSLLSLVETEGTNDNATEVLTTAVAMDQDNGKANIKTVAANDKGNESTGIKTVVASTKEKDNKDTKTETKETIKTETNKKSNKESKKDKEVAETLANGLILSHNTSMIKKLSVEELEVLQRIVEAEATGEDIYGKILVANVVLNRVNDEGFPDTVKEVVFQKSGGSYQFSPTRDGRYWSVTVSDSTIEAVERALTGEDYSEGALYFFARRLTTSKKAKWFDNSLDRLFKYGCHEFYKNK